MMIDVFVLKPIDLSERNNFASPIPKFNTLAVRVA